MLGFTILGRRPDPGGKNVSQAVSLLDVSRTILEAAGGDPLEYPLHHGTPLAMTQEEEPRWVIAQPGDSP